MEREAPAGDALKPNEVPPGAGDEEPKGMPNSDRHQSETAHEPGPPKPAHAQPTA